MQPSPKACCLFSPRRSKMAGSRPRWLHDRRNCGLSRQAYSDFFTRKKMIRAFAFLFAAVMVLAGGGHARAHGLPNFFHDSRGIIGGGPGFFPSRLARGSIPIPPTPLKFITGP